MGNHSLKMCFPCTFIFVQIKLSNKNCCTRTRFETEAEDNAKRPMARFNQFSVDEQRPWQISSLFITLQIVQARSEKIAEEEDKCRVMAENAQHDLDEALPALAEATKALESLNKKDMTEIKSYGRPPALVEKVMEAVMILRGGEPTWAEAKRQLGEFYLPPLLYNIPPPLKFFNPVALSNDKLCDI